MEGGREGREDRREGGKGGDVRGSERDSWDAGWRYMKGMGIWLRAAKARRLGYEEYKYFNSMEYRKTKSDAE